MKSISTINPAITEDTERLIDKEHALFIDLKVGVSLDNDVSLHFALVWAIFQAENYVRSAPASSALTLVLHWNHNVRTTIVTFAAVEKWMELKGEQIWQNHDASTGTAAVGKTARLGTKWHWTVKKSSL